MPVRSEVAESNATCQGQGQVHEEVLRMRGCGQREKRVRADQGDAFGMSVRPCCAVAMLLCCVVATGCV